MIEGGENGASALPYYGVNCGLLNLKFPIFC